MGTAGHIDHGKSALVRALTGVDPDRLKEEKARGITIDLGFAHKDLGGGLMGSFIDVPGHERFVRNMLAGAHGIDLVLLVVAADESVMPQTREHFHICRLLDIPRGVIALTKCDVADAAAQGVAEMEVRELVAASFLEAAPVLRVSARTGLGLSLLEDALRQAAADLPPRTAEGLLRMPVDRVFTLKGFGTVVTGTLVSGQIALGEEVELLPSGRRARVRGLQVHGQPVETVTAGHRTAVNLAGVEVAEVARGDVLMRPDTLRATSMVDVELSLLPGEPPLRDQARLRIHAGSAEVLGRVRFSDAMTAEPGRGRRAQLRLESPAVLGRGDRLVLRAYSPARTLGGAVVSDPLPPKRRRRTATAHLPLETALDARAAARALIAGAGPQGLDLVTLAARVTAPAATLATLLAGDPEVTGLGGEGAAYVASAILPALADALLARVAAFHRENPLRTAMPREELRARVFPAAAPGLFECVLDALAASARIRVTTEGVSLPEHTVRLQPAEEKARAALLASAELAGLTGLPAGVLPDARGHGIPALSARVARVLVTDGTLRRVGETLVLGRLLDQLRADVRARWPPGTALDVGGFKELTGLTRKHVIPLLEHLDRERVTRRAGASRIVLP